ncbi:MAG: hypothetical protein ACYC4U_15610 [Pirellulaceae bacterium]
MCKLRSGIADECILLQPLDRKFSSARSLLWLYAIRLLLLQGRILARRFLPLCHKQFCSCVQSNFERVA